MHKSEGKLTKETQRKERKSLTCNLLFNALKKKITKHKAGARMLGNKK